MRSRRSKRRAHYRALTAALAVAEESTASGHSDAADDHLEAALLELNRLLDAWV